MKRSTLAALLISPIALGRARLLYTGPEDIYAFPKYRVAFLNEFPILNETAQRWIQYGLRGGEEEFLGESWNSHTWFSQEGMKEIGSSESGTLNNAPDVCTFDVYNYLPTELT